MKLREFDFDYWYKNRDPIEVRTRCGLSICSLAYLEEIETFYGTFLGTFIGTHKTFDMYENLYEKWDKNGRSYFKTELDLMLEVNE